MSKPTSQLSDVELKDHGNKLFAARKFDDAILCYNKAIVSIKKVKIYDHFHLISFCLLTIRLAAYSRKKGNRKKKEVIHLCVSISIRNVII